MIFLSAGVTVAFGHCIGMCGPIVLSLSLHSKGKALILSHLLYHTGRVMMYAILGGLMGWTGSFTTIASGIAGLQKVIMILSGFMIILMALNMGAWFPPVRSFPDSCNPGGIISRGFRWISASRSPLGHLPLGLLLGLLPCGPVYTALIAAARAGMESTDLYQGFLRGAALMFAFGAGTIPGLLLVAQAANLGWLGVRSREAVYKISSLLMVVVGITFVVKGIRY